MPKDIDIIPVKSIRWIFDTAKALGRYDALRELFSKERFFTDQQRNYIYGLAMVEREKLTELGIKFQAASEGELPKGDHFDPSLGNVGKPEQ